MKKSKFFNLGWRDVIHGLLMAGLGSIAMSLTTVFNTLAETGSVDYTLNDFYLTLGAAGGAMGLYLIKVLTENSEGKIMKKEPK